MKPLFHIVLIKPEIPHNTGAIGRLCVGLDCPLHLIRPLGFHLTDSYIKRAGLDYWEYLDVTVHDDWQSFLDKTRPSGLHFLSTKGKKSLYECSFKRNDALIFGSESAGLPEYMYSDYEENLFRIPMPGEHARSINLANAASIAAYEALRQMVFS